VTDVAIVGAGVVGASVAYWLARLAPGLSVALIERDRSFSRASSALSASSIRQQFSSPVNIRMSAFGAQFLREMELPLHEAGYLYLAQPSSAEALRQLNTVQTAHGARVALLAPEELVARFPWLNAGDLALGSLGLAGEGWFDGPALHAKLLQSARASGARLVEAEVLGFEQASDGTVLGLRLADGTRISCRHAVNAAGPWAASVAAAAGIALPVHARRRTVFVLACPERLAGCPLVVDPSGFWFRPEGIHYLAGVQPALDADDLPLEPDFGEFDEALWARMAHRVPAFAALRVVRAWAGYYEMNVFDYNAIIGAHPAAPNLWFANGFSGHGMQQAPAAGKGIAELIVHGEFRSLDLSALGFERLLRGAPLHEANIIG
jgi:glycine/D-amino acid oxidase-like deaminating enzyme